MFIVCTFLPKQSPCLCKLSWRINPILILNQVSWSREKSKTCRTGVPWGQGFPADRVKNHCSRTFLFLNLHPLLCLCVMYFVCCFVCICKSANKVWQIITGLSGTNRKGSVIVLEMKVREGSQHRAYWGLFRCFPVIAVVSSGRRLMGGAALSLNIKRKPGAKPVLSILRWFHPHCRNHGVSWMVFLAYMFA